MIATPRHGDLVSIEGVYADGTSAHAGARPDPSKPLQLFRVVAAPAVQGVRAWRLVPVNPDGSDQTWRAAAGEYRIEPLAVTVR